MSIIKSTSHMIWQYPNQIVDAAPCVLSSQETFPNEASITEEHFTKYCCVVQVTWRGEEMRNNLIHRTSSLWHETYGLVQMNKQLGRFLQKERVIQHCEEGNVDGSRICLDRSNVCSPGTIVRRSQSCSLLRSGPRIASG